MLRSNLVSLVAVALATLAVVVAVYARWDTGADARDYICRYLEAIGDVHHYPLDSCRVVSLTDHSAIVAIHQNHTDYTLNVNLVRTPWQVLAADQ